MREVATTEGEIRLGQLLKLADLADTGGAARALRDHDAVTVNGEVERRRGRRLRRGDVVLVEGHEPVRVT